METEQKEIVETFEFLNMEVSSCRMHIATAVELVKMDDITNSFFLSHGGSWNRCLEVLNLRK